MFLTKNFYEQLKKKLKKTKMMNRKIDSGKIRTRARFKYAPDQRPIVMRSILAQEDPGPCHY